MGSEEYELEDDDIFDPVEYKRRKEAAGFGFGTSLAGSILLDVGTKQALRRLAPKFAKKSGAAMAATALAGALYGTAEGMYRGDPAMEVAKNAATEAIIWPVLGTAGAGVGQGIKTLWKGQGIKEAYNQATKHAFSTANSALEDILDITTPGGMGSGLVGTRLGRFAARKIGDLINPAPKALRESGSEALETVGEGFFNLNAAQKNVLSSAEQLRVGIDELPMESKSLVHSILTHITTGKSISDIRMQYGSNPAWDDAMGVLRPVIKQYSRVGEQILEDSAGEVDTKFLAELFPKMLSAVPQKDSWYYTPILAKMTKELITEGKTPNVQKALDNIIKSPLIPNDSMLKIYARDYYDLGITTASAVNESYRKASTDFFIDGLKSVGEGVIAKASIKGSNPKDWIFLQAGKFDAKQFPLLSKLASTFDGQYIDWDIFRGIYDFDDAMRYANPSLLQQIVRTWKVSRAVARPGALFRNAFGNFALNSVKGEFPLAITRIDVYARELPEFYKAFKYGAKNEAEDFIFRNGGKGKIGMSWEELDSFSEVLQNALKEGIHLPNALMSAFNNSKIVKGAESFYSFTELFTKYTKYKWNLTHGMTKTRALMDAVESTFNYGEVTPAVRWLRDSFVPFATFSTKMLTAMPEILFKNPIRAAPFVAIPWALTQMALKNLDISDEEFENIRAMMPEYTKQNMFLMLPVRDEKGRLQMIDLTWWLPGMQEVNIQNIFDPTSWIQNPILTVSADVYNNKKHLTGAPVYNNFDTGAVKLGKSLNYLYQQFFPTWMPPTSVLPGISAMDTHIPGAQGGVDWSGVMSAVTGKTNAPTAFQSGLSVGTGIKITPVDEQLIAYQKSQAYKAMSRDIDKLMNQELRRYPQRSEEIIAKFTALKKEMLRKQYNDIGHIGG